MTQPRLLGGRYELDGVIGRGGMAEVYRARDLRLDRIVAVKTLRSDLARDPTFQARFSREAQSAASLNHPSVIAVYDTGEDTIGEMSIPYIVMEYAEGQTLRDLLRENRRLRPDRAMEIVDGILRALDYSHRGGIVHRDIKPANVMLTRNHEVKVMDFGIARAMADTGATMTQTAQVIGTAQYLSPEQARGERVDARSDIYSTGCVLYELLTGRPPFVGDSPVAIAYQHVREEPIPPSQIDPEIPDWADAIVFKSMAKDANVRYQSAAEMRADIQRAVQGMPVAAATMAMHGTQVMGAAGQPPMQTQMQRPVPTDYGLPPVRYDEQPPEREGNGKKVAIWLLLGVAFIAVAGLLGYMLSGGGGGGGDDPATAKILVPSVADFTVKEATDALQKAGLTVNPEPQRKFDEEIAKGKVIATDPAETTEVDKGSAVTLIVSKGPEVVKVQVPEVTNVSLGTAKVRLTQAGLKFQTRTQASDTVAKGTVISSDPSVGSEVEKGSTVTLTVSGGPDTVEVPQVVGRTKDDAIRLLESLGLKAQVQIVNDPNGDNLPGTVVRQSPDQGTRVQPGSTIIIVVYEQQTPSPGDSGNPGNGGGGFFNN